jgi:phage/plasmid-associated DNA primase
MGEDEVVERVLDATREAVEGRPDWNWDGEDRSLHGMCTSWHKKHPPKPEKKRKPLAKRPNIDKPIVTADPNQQVDRRDDDEPAGAQVFNLAVARAERDIKKADKKAVHVVLGRGLLDALAERSEPILYEGVWMHRYRRGLWERVFPDLAAMWINTETQIGCESLGITPSTRLRSEVRNWIASVQELQHEEVPWDKHGGIATRSGLFNLKTMKIEPLKPEHYATRCVDSEYDAKATCPWWIRMLEDTFPDDQDTIDVLQEIAGAALLAYKPRTLNKALLLRGETNSGKSNILIVLASMFGGTPITQPLAKIDGNHGLQPFVQHAPWLLTEAFERSGWHPSSTVKKILSGEAVTIDPKNAPQVTHIFRGPVFWGSNYPAKFKEASKAMIERIRPIPCEVEFDPENPVGAAEEAGKRGYDHPYDLVLENERPGVLNWMLEGLIRARARGFIKNTHYMVDELAAVRTESNSVAGFVAAGCAELDEKFMVLKSDLLAAITMWHSSEYSTDHRTLSNNEIKQEIKASYANRLVDYRSDGEDYYVGVELTNKGLRFWSSVNDPFRRVAAGKVAELSLDHDKVNRTSPVTLKEARALRAQRREADRERKRHG